MKHILICLTLWLTGFAAVGDVQAASRLSERPAPAWVGTVLPGGQLERPRLCARRGGVAAHRAYNLNGTALTGRKDREGRYWTGRLGDAVLDWVRRDRRYLSFARRSFIVAAWCAEPRRPNTGRIVIQPDGTPVVIGRAVSDRG